MVRPFLLGGLMGNIMRACFRLSVIKGSSHQLPYFCVLFNWPGWHRLGMRRPKINFTFIMNLLDRFKKISAFVFDMDGVLTDGAVYVFNDGEQVRKMHIRDGFALQLAVKKGYRVAVVSGGRSEGAVDRLNKLGVTDVFMNVLDKKSVLLQYMADNGISKDEALFMGDDIPDYEAMKESGLSCAPSDAAQEIKKAADYITTSEGGMGCVREVIEKTLKLNGHWEIITDVASR